MGGALLALFAVLAVGLGWRSRAWPLIHDAPIMHYIAWRIAEGAAPYRDLFDMNGPGVYLLHLAVLRLGGPGDFAWRAFDLAWLAVGALAVGALAAPWGLVAAAGGGLFFVVHHLAGGAWQAGQRDFLLCPLLLLGALGVARWLECPRQATSLAWGGLALGASIAIKPHAALFAATLGVVVLVGGWRAGAALPATIFVTGVALPLLAVVGWVAVLGALTEWRTVVLDYLVPLYSRLGRPAHWGFHRWQAWIPVGVAVALSLVSAAARRRFTPRHGVAALGLAYGVVHYVGQGKGWEYHVYPLAAFAAALLFSELEPMLRSRRWVAGSLLGGSLAALGLLFGAKGVEAGDAEWIRDKERRVSAVVRELDGRLGPGDLVQVLDTTEGGVHALLRLRAVQPTRFLYDFPLFHDFSAPVIQRLRAEFMRDLGRRPPRFIVLFRRGWPGGGAERVEAFPELHHHLAAAYRLHAQGDGYIVYAKRDDS
ncbi:MAG: hypothetical protein AUG00_09780 [Candidatus Rokubacteria bacterium 13_1_20CM_2_70_7]|nr:MAG: hypothetical protein AUG00_09780 [Candidatus Rokubacteria bacterium 13_1_20CM_2_70_7]